MKLQLVAAIDENRVIGELDGEMPWARQMPADITYLKNLVAGHPLIFGRKTYQASAKYFDSTKTYVFSKSSRADLELDENVGLLNNLDDLMNIKLRGGNKQVFVLGGGEIYNLLLPYAEKVYLTQIKHTFDLKNPVMFPELSEDWELSSKEEHFADSLNKFDYTFEIYKKVI